MWPMMVSMELAHPSWGPRGTAPQPGQASPSRAARAWRLAQQLRRPLPSAQAEPPTLGGHARGRHGAGKGAQDSLAPGPVSGHGVQEGVRLKWNGWRPSQCRANPKEQRRARSPKGQATWAPPVQEEPSGVNVMCVGVDFL